MAVLVLSVRQEGGVESTPCATGGGFSLCSHTVKRNLFYSGQIWDAVDEDTNKESIELEVRNSSPCGWLHILLCDFKQDTLTPWPLPVKWPRGMLHRICGLISMSSGTNFTAELSQIIPRFWPALVGPIKSSGTFYMDYSATYWRKVGYEKWRENTRTMWVIV